MNRARGWTAVLLPLLPLDRCDCQAPPQPLPPTHALGPGGPQFSYGWDYLVWLAELRHDPTNPYDDLGGEA